MKRGVFYLCFNYVKANKTECEYVQGFIEVITINFLESCVYYY